MTSHDPQSFNAVNSVTIAVSRERRTPRRYTAELLLLLLLLQFKMCQVEGWGAGEKRTRERSTTAESEKREGLARVRHSEGAESESELIPVCAIYTQGHTKSKYLGFPIIVWIKIKDEWIATNIKRKWSNPISNNPANVKETWLHPHTAHGYGYRGIPKPNFPPFQFAQTNWSLTKYLPFFS